MSPNKTLRIYAGLRGWWYIIFLDAHGIERHLPIEKKLWGRWKPENCLRVQPNHRPDVYRIAAESNPDPQKVLTDFTKKYPTVEAYLKYINNKHKHEKAKCG